MPQPTLSAGRWSCPFDIPIPRWAARGIVSSDDLDSTGTRGRLPSARKLIDVYPDEVAGQAELGGYQLMVAADIFRGRYRESPETAKAIPPGEALTYRFALPTAHHVFLPGHRIMVQVQSSWFPLYDRNPQTLVPNIFWARPQDYTNAIQRVFHEPGRMSSVELPVVSSH